MPQCQRSPNNTIMEAVGRVSETVWVCPGEPFSPGCPGGETYELVSAPPLRPIIDTAVEMCAREFTADVPTQELQVFLGEHPMAVPYDSRREIYLCRDSNLWQHHRQVAHEVFHYLCTPRQTFHWSHEMLADMWTGIFLRRQGLGWYWDDDRASLLEDAPSCSLVEMLQWTQSPPYPPGFYGRALATGEALEKRIGWAELAPLAHRFAADGRPDVDGWLRSLPADAETAARSVLDGAASGTVAD